MGLIGKVFDHIVSRRRHSSAQKGIDLATGLKNLMIAVVGVVCSWVHRRMELFPSMVEGAF